MFIPSMVGPRVEPDHAELVPSWGQHEQETVFTVSVFVVVQLSTTGHKYGVYANRKVFYPR